jgi:hypothetical protein
VLACCTRGGEEREVEVRMAGMRNWEVMRERARYRTVRVGPMNSDK